MSIECEVLNLLQKKQHFGTKRPADLVGEYIVPDNKYFYIGNYSEQMGEFVDPLTQMSPSTTPMMIDTISSGLFGRYYDVGGFFGHDLKGEVRVLLYKGGLLENGKADDRVYNVVNCLLRDLNRGAERSEYQKFILNFAQLAEPGDRLATYVSTDAPIDFVRTGIYLRVFVYNDDLKFKLQSKDIYLKTRSEKPEACRDRFDMLEIDD